MGNSWNFDLSWAWSWKSHGILKFEQKVMEKSWNLTNKTLILMNWGRSAAVFQIPVSVFAYEDVMEFYDMVMEKSWNFVANISWQP